MEGCNKTYSNRQNRYRHKLQEHPNTMSSKVNHKFPKTEAEIISQNEVNLQRERELLIETFCSFYDQCGEEQAAIAMRNNKKLRNHLIPLRKIMEADIAQHLYDAQESQSRVESQLTEFKNALPAGSTAEKAAFKSVISLVKNATPDSIEPITSLTEHMESYSENVNHKLKQSRFLKSILDEMFTEAVDELGIPVSPPTNGKRKATASNTTSSDDVPEFRIPSPKKSRGFGKFFASLFTEDDEAALLQPEDDDRDR